MSSLDPEDSRQFLSRVHALLEQRMFEQALGLAENRLRRLSDDVDARIAMCRIWTKMGRLDQVEEILRDVEKRMTDWSRVYAAMSDICRESGLRKEAARFYGRFRAINPQESEYQNAEEKPDPRPNFGAVSLQEEEDKEHYDQLSDIAPDFHTMTLAELYLRQNQPEMARNVLEEIIRREPHHREAGIRLREIETRLGGSRSDLDPKGNDEVLRELMRWLRNISRIGNYAT